MTRALLWVLLGVVALNCFNMATNPKIGNVTFGVLVAINLFNACMAVRMLLQQRRRRQRDRMNRVLEGLRNGTQFPSRVIIALPEMATPVELIEPGEKWQRQVRDIVDANRPS